MNEAEQQQRFAEWTANHRAVLHHVVNAFADADHRPDLMQEVLLALWKAIPAFRGDAHPSTFIYRVSHNTALTWRRRRGTYRRVMEQASREPPPTPSSGREPQLERLYAAIRELPPLDRSLLLLSLDEVSYREMAEIHGIAENLVGVRLTRARAKLIELMKEETR